MTREEAIKTLKENYCAMCAYGSQDMDSCDIRSCDNKDAIKALEQTRWIPMTTRPMDDDEKEHFAEQLEYVDDAEIFNCPLPDDGQEVLITIYGETEIDTFLRDDVDGCYFENRDIEDVRAWMSLPQPYKGESEDGESNG